MPKGIRLRLRTRLFFAFFFTLLLPMAFLMFFSGKTLFQGVHTLEEASLDDSLQTATAALDFVAQQIAANVQDYAHWDEMYDPLTGRDPEWLRRSITEWIPGQFDIDVIWLADPNGNIYYAYNNPSEFSGNVRNLSLFQKARKGEETYEFLSIGSKVMIGASSFVSPTSVDRSFSAVQQSPAVLFYGRYIDSDVASQISAVTGREIKFFSETELLATSDRTKLALIGFSIDVVAPEVQQVFTSTTSLKWMSAEQHSIYQPIIDSNNRRIGAMGVHNSAAIGNFVRSQLNASLLTGILTAFLVGLVLAFYFGGRMARAVKALNQQVQEYTHGDYHHEVVVNRRDELGELQASFAYLIKRLEKAKVHLHEQEMTILDILAQTSEKPNGEIVKLMPPEKKRPTKKKRAS